MVVVPIFCDLNKYEKGESKGSAGNDRHALDLFPKDLSKDQTHSTSLGTSFSYWFVLRRTHWT